jgi:predicted alpha/beta-hydrolase family hydrolase
METVRIEIAASDPVTGLLMHPPDATACFVFAHGAGAGMTHPFMQAVATGLFDRRIATLRYQFPYMERVQSGRTRRP